MRQDAFDYAVSDIPKADLDRLIDQLTPLAKCPPYINVTAENAAITREWYQHRELPQFAPSIVWEYLSEKFAEERRAAGERDRDIVVVMERLGGPLQFKLPYARMNATEYFALRGDSGAHKPNSAEAPQHPSTMQRVAAALRGFAHL